MPATFLKNIQKYADEDSINFTGLHFLEVGIYVFTGQWSKLYKHYVQLSDTPRGEADVIAMMKSRLRPCSAPVAGG